MNVYDPDQQDLHTSYDSAGWLQVDAVILFHWVWAGAEGTFTRAATRQVYQFQITGNGCWLLGRTIKNILMGCRLTRMSVQFYCL